jgi:hypothetical protein
MRLEGEMNRTVSKLAKRFVSGVMRRGYLVAIVVAATFVSAAPAQAQVSDAWKSAAIIGGSTAAGAYLGHKIAGSSGAYVGAAAGAAAGYAIDQRRRQNEYNDGYSSDGPYGDNGGSYGNDDQSSRSGRSNRGAYPDSSQYPDSSGYPDPNYYTETSRRR